jgi:hypothetical protein
MLECLYTGTVETVRARDGSAQHVKMDELLEWLGAATRYQVDALRALCEAH